MRTYFLPVLVLAAVTGLAWSQPAVGVRPPPDVSTKEPPTSGIRPVSYSEGPSPIQIAPVVPPVFLLLTDADVQQEIALRGDQKTAADRVRLGWSVPARGVYLGRFGKVSADALRAAANGRTADFLANGLTKEQRTRLDQILFQLREKEFGSHQALVMASRDLGMRSDQMEDVRSLKALRVEEIDKAVTSGKRFEKVKLEVQATNGDTYDKMAEMLTRAQRERLKELRGKPFDRIVNAATPPPTVPLAKKAPAPYPAPNGGFYDLELLYVVSPPIRTELNLSDAQVKGLSEAWDQATGGAGLSSGLVPAGWIELVHLKTEKALSDHLSKDQRARFDQVMMQRRARVSPEAVCTYPMAVAALKLTPIQLKELSAGKPLAEALSKGQREQHAQLLGKPFDLPAVKDDYLPKQAIPPAPIPEIAIALARDFLRLSDRLGLTAEQIKKLRDLAEDEPKIRELIHKELSLEDTPPIAGSGRALTSERAVTEHYRQAVEQQCWDTLDPAQQSIARKLFGRGR